MYRIPILEVESTVVLFDPEEKRMIRELNERLDCGENDVVRDAVREYYKQKCISVLVPGLDRIFLDSSDGDRIVELMKRTGKTESEVIKEALKHYDELLRIADLFAELSNP